MWLLNQSVLVVFFEIFLFSFKKKKMHGWLITHIWWSITIVDRSTSYGNQSQHFGKKILCMRPKHQKFNPCSLKSQKQNPRRSHCSTSQPSIEKTWVEEREREKEEQPSSRISYILNPFILFLRYNLKTLFFHYCYFINLRLITLFDCLKYGLDGVEMFSKEIINYFMCCFQKKRFILCVVSWFFFQKKYTYDFRCFYVLSCFVDWILQAWVESMFYTLTKSFCMIDLMILY